MTLQARSLRIIALAATVSVAHAQLSVEFTFNPSQTGSTCALTGDSDVWVYGCFGTTIDRYASDGTHIASIPAPGGSANDVDLDIVSQPMTLGTSAVPAGSLLFFDGESGVCEVYAVDSATGAVIGSLATGFGSSHVVGGAYDAATDSLFLLQDNVPGGTLANQVAQVDPISGAILSTFHTSAAGFNVSYGDLDVSSTNGHLYLVSSIESRIGVFSTSGALLSSLPLPPGVGSLSGIGIDDLTGGAWVCSNGGVVWRLGDLVEIGAPYCQPAVANSTGSPALCRAFGSDERASDRVLLVAFQLPNNSFGYFLTSITQGLVVGPGGSQGDLCLGGDIGRYNASGQVFNSLSVGRAELALALGATPTPALGLISIQAGETWHYQAWYRDANPTSTSNFTDAVSILYR